MNAGLNMRGGKWLAIPLSLAAAPAAFAQGCVLCYTSAAAQSPRAIHALNQAILVLLIPPLLLFVGIFALIFWRRNSSRGDVPAKVEAMPSGRFPAAQPSLSLSSRSHAH